MDGPTAIKTLNSWTYKRNGLESGLGVPKGIVDELSTSLHKYLHANMMGFCASKKTKDKQVKQNGITYGKEAGSSKGDERLLVQAEEVTGDSNCRMVGIYWSTIADGAAGIRKKSKPSRNRYSIDWLFKTED